GTTWAPVVFSGGHETDRRDGGRPVALIASALGAPPQVFREAFSHVRPAPAGTRPDPAQVRLNKQALLAALSRYGVTNERLDIVSNYYRYNRSRGEMWPTVPAVAYALVKDGTVVRFAVTKGGAGYSSPPTVTIPGVNNVVAKAQLLFSQSSNTNGSVAAIMFAPAPRQ
nr:hypothetical protein [Armatimonadota bacterium]